MPYDTTASYQGMSGQVWGSQIYYESTRVAYKDHAVTDRPIALSRDNGPNWNSRESIQSQTFTGSGSPAHHRFPVWWTGDGVPLMADVGAMTNEAVHDFRSYVHSDCGGHGDCKSVDPPHVPGQPPPPPPEDVPCKVSHDPVAVESMRCTCKLTAARLNASRLRPTKRCCDGPRE